MTDCAQLVFVFEVEKEVDGRWIAEVMNIPGAMAYGSSAKDAIIRAQAVALFALNLD